MEMTEQQIQEEVQARIDFKFNEFLEGMRNRAKTEWSIAFHQNSQKHSYFWEAFEQMVKMAEKERIMGVPNDQMALIKKRKAKDVAVDEIMGKLNHHLYGVPSRGRDTVVKCIVSAIEKAQNYL